MCYAHVRQTLWFWPVWESAEHDERRKIRVRKCERSGKSISHLPPKWKLSCPGLLQNRPGGWNCGGAAEKLSPKKKKKKKLSPFCDPGTAGGLSRSLSSQT